MSGQPSQRVRRNASPSHTKTGPIKAKAFPFIKHGSPTRSLNAASPTANVGTQKPWTRKSPDVRASPERRSPGSGSPNYKDKSKVHRQSPVLTLKRTNSLDTLGPYLTGQWPKESYINMYHHYQTTGVFMLDKSSQTPEDWEVSSEHVKNKSHKRSSSFGQGDQQTKKEQYIKQQLQQLRKKDKYNESSKPRQSPVQGNHSALSLTAPPTVFAQSKAIHIPTSHIPKTPMSRYQRNSVEGLSMEIEKLWLKEVHSSTLDTEDVETAFREVPDGHRAPVPEVQRITCLMRSVDTQTPSSNNDEDKQGSSGGRCDSISPAINIFLGPMDLSLPSSRSQSSECKSEKEESPELLSTYPTSPRLEKFPASPKPDNSYNFVREPPDGCEKVKAIEEFRQTPEKEPSFFCPVKPNQFVFKPSVGSAFYPALKPLLASSTPDTSSLCTSALASNTATSIETQ